MKLKLKGKSRKGKNRVREHGELWDVLKTEKSVQCCNGSGWFIQPVNGNDDATRWVGQSNDPDFEIEIFNT